MCCESTIYIYIYARVEIYCDKPPPSTMSLHRGSFASNGFATECKHSHLSIHPPTHPSIHPSIRPSIQPIPTHIHTYIHTYTHTCIRSGLSLSPPPRPLSVDVDSLLQFPHRLVPVIPCACRRAPSCRDRETRSRGLMHRYTYSIHII